VSAYTAILPTGNPAASAILSLAPDALLGWPEAPPGSRPPAHPLLPEVARLNAHELAPSVAAVRAMAPDLVLDFGTDNAVFAGFAKRLQAETGVPVALIDGSLANSAASLRRLGALLGVPERGEALAAYFERLWQPIAEALPAGGPRVHYAIGPRGEKTVRQGSIHLDVITLTGGEFVAPVDAGPGGRVSVSPAAVAAADPDLILTIDPDFHAAAQRLDIWADMAAVRAGRVYLAPAPVLSWLDYPPGPNRIIGLAWLARLFHGMDIDVAAEAQAFHTLFHGQSLDEPVLAEALGMAGIG
jgi:iron complex transport system substrate-binding protein